MAYLPDINKPFFIVTPYMVAVSELWLSYRRRYNELRTLQKKFRQKKSTPWSDTKETATIQALCAEWMTVERSNGWF